MMKKTTTQTIAMTINRPIITPAINPPFPPPFVLVSKLSSGVGLDFVSGLEPGLGSVSYTHLTLPTN